MLSACCAWPILDSVTGPNGCLDARSLTRAAAKGRNCLAVALSPRLLDAAASRLYCGSTAAREMLRHASFQPSSSETSLRSPRGRPFSRGLLERVTFRLGGAAVAACPTAWPHVLHPAAKKCDRTGVLGLSWVGHPNLIGGQRPAVATLWIAGAYRAILLIFTRV